MSSNTVTVFLTGATGYIGGSVLQRLLAHPNRKNLEITALVRSADKAKRLETEFGVKTVVGSLQDLNKLTDLSENAHIVIHTADCDDLDAINAILSGQKARQEKTGDLPILVHTSGTGELADEALGAYASEKVYSDVDVAGIEELPPTAVHRPVDLVVVAADQAGYTRAHIIMPSVIYGTATGPLFDGGISNPHTIVFPLYVRAALTNGNVAVLNDGASIWGNVHVTDTADLYIRLFDTVLASPEKVSHGREGYFFAASDEFSARQSLEEVAKVLHSLGRISSPELVKYSLEEIGEYYGRALPPTFPTYSVQMIARLLFTNTRCKAERGRRELGWAPKHTTEDLIESVKSEVPLLVKKVDAEKSA